MYIQQQLFSERFIGSLFGQNPKLSENSVKPFAIKLLKNNNYMTIVLFQQTSSIIQDIPNFENWKKRSNINIMVTHPSSHF